MGTPRTDIAMLKNRSRGGALANRTGRHLEQVIAASAMGVHVRLVGLPKCGGRFIGPGKMINEEMPCDFIGTFINGPALFFDAKSCEEERAGLPLHASIVKPHQLVFLRKMSCAGAVAGFLVESKRRGAYLFMQAREILATDSSLAWDDPRWVFLGETSGLVRFELLRGLTPAPLPASTRGEKNANKGNAE